MKRILYYILFVGVIGCYSDDTTQTIQSENNANRNSELTRLVKSITLHNASFDDIIDNTSCLSLKFPYQIQVNSELRTINTLQDISDISHEDDIEIIYPVSSVFYNYETHEVSSRLDFNLIKNTCSQDFDIQSNTCLELQYPITFKEFNDLTQSFETFHLNTDKEVFLHLENLHDNDIFEIEYPILLSDFNSNSIEVNSNADFISTYNVSLQDCE